MNKESREFQMYDIPVEGHNVIQMVTVLYPSCYWCELSCLVGMRHVINDLRIICKYILIQSTIGSDASHVMFVHKNEGRGDINKKVSTYASNTIVSTRINKAH